MNNNNRQLVIDKLAAIKKSKLINELDDDSILFRYTRNGSVQHETVKQGHPKWGMFKKILLRLLEREEWWPLVYTELYPGHPGLPFAVPPGVIEHHSIEVRITDLEMSVDIEKKRMCVAVDFEEYA